MGLLGRSYTFAAEVTPISTTLPIEYAWQATDQPPISHTGGLTDSVSFNWETTGEKVITVTASNADGSVGGSHTITLVILDQQAYLPAVMRAAPAFLERIDWR
jgi:hypothetical protein